MENTAEQLKHSIDAIDFDRLAAIAQHKNPEIDDNWLSGAIELYKKYLFLCGMYPDEALAPGRAADFIWHQHILSTKQYAEDCQRVFGRYLHHAPADPRNPTNELEMAQVAERTRELFGLHFEPIEADRPRCISDGGGGNPCACGTSCKLDQ